MKVFFLKMNDGVHLKVKVAAAQDDMTMSDYIVRAILEKLVNDEEKGKGDG